MIKLLKHTVFILIVGLCAVNTRGQALAQDEEALDLLKGVFELYEKDFSKIQEGEYLDISYSMIIDSKYSQEQIIEQCQVYFDGKTRRFSTASMDIIQNDDVTINIVNEGQVIYISHTGGADKRQILLENIAISQKNILKYVQDSHVEKLEKDKRRVTLYLDENGQRSVGVRKMIYVLDVKSNRLISSTAEYTASSMKRKITINFKNVQMRRGTCHALPDVPIALIETNGKLKPQYSNYQIVDTRKK